MRFQTLLVAIAATAPSVLVHASPNYGSWPTTCTPSPTPCSGPGGPWTCGSQGSDNGHFIIEEFYSWTNSYIGCQATCWGQSNCAAFGYDQVKNVCYLFDVSVARAGFRSGRSSTLYWDLQGCWKKPAPCTSTKTTTTTTPTSTCPTGAPTTITNTATVTQPPVTSSVTVTQAPVTSSVTVTQLPVTSSVTVTQAPVTSSVTVTQPPVTSSVTVTQPPVTVSSTVTVTEPVVTVTSTVTTSSSSPAPTCVQHTFAMNAPQASSGHNSMTFVQDGTTGAFFAQPLSGGGTLFRQNTDCSISGTLDQNSYYTAYIDTTQTGTQNVVFALSAASANAASSNSNANYQPLICSYTANSAGGGQAGLACSLNGVYAFQFASYDSADSGNNLQIGPSYTEEPAVLLAFQFN